MTPAESKVLFAVRKITNTALNQWKYRHNTVMGEFARAVVEWRREMDEEKDPVIGELLDADEVARLICEISRRNGWRLTYKLKKM